MKSKIDVSYKKVAGIYLITNKSNNKVYVGSSVNLYKRIYEHFRELNNGAHANQHLQQSFNRYGESNFEVSILASFKRDEITDQELRNLETQYIQRYKAADDQYGYNFMPVGMGTSSEAFTEERKRKISKANKGRAAYNKGVAMSEEQRTLLSKIHVEKHGKAVICYSIFGDFVAEYPSVTEAAKTFKVIKRDVIDVCRGKRGRLHDCIFRYKGEKDLDPMEFLKNTDSHAISYSAPFYFEVSKDEEIHKFAYTKDLMKFLQVPYRHKPLQKLLKQLYTLEKDFVMFKDYTIKYKYALGNGDITNATRQPDLKSGVSDEANGET